MRDNRIAIEIVQNSIAIVFCTPLVSSFVFYTVLNNEIKTDLAESLIPHRLGRIHPRFIAMLLLKPVVKKCKHVHRIPRQTKPVWGAYFTTDA